MRCTDRLTIIIFNGISKTITPLLLYFHQRRSFVGYIITSAEKEVERYPQGFPVRRVMAFS